MDQVKLSKRMRRLASAEGFSLTEILIVLAIIGILILIALPNFKPLITKVKTTEARDQLRYAKMLQETYYFEHDRYASSLQELGFAQNALVTEGGEARYRIEVINADGQGFEITATAVVDFDKDGVFNQWKVDQNGKISEIVPD
jgi:type IV pilus assembly protein PilE